jgi:hypothetical protein
MAPSDHCLPVTTLMSATFIKLRNVVQGWVDISDFGGSDTKPMCYAYYFAARWRQSISETEAMLVWCWCGMGWRGFGAAEACRGIGRS